jgi:hypothetical protein
LTAQSTAITNTGDFEAEQVLLLLYLCLHLLERIVRDRAGFLQLAFPSTKRLLIFRGASAAGDKPVPAALIATSFPPWGPDMRSGKCQSVLGTHQQKATSGMPHAAEPIGMEGGHFLRFMMGATLP